MVLEDPVYQFFGVTLAFEVPLIVLFLTHEKGRVSADDPGIEIAKCLLLQPFERWLEVGQETSLPVGDAKPNVIDASDAQSIGGPDELVPLIA